MVMAFTSHLASAQCDGCKSADDFKADYCYKNKAFEAFCAQFAEKSDYLYLNTGKKLRQLPLVNDDSLAYYLGMANNKKLKITAKDVLFLQLAYAEWFVVKRDLGMVFEDNGLGIKTLVEGTGELPVKGKKVFVHYTGYLEDGTKFDSSLDRGTPFDFVLGVGRVIKGWDEAVARLKVGSKALVKIPSELGYGRRGAGGTIPPNATLYFEIEVLNSEQ